jgi:hypothetical protein
MKIFIVVAVVLFIVVTEKKACKKSECLKGKVVAVKCMGTVIQITDGKFDPSLVAAKWKDSLKVQGGETVPELSNVFRLKNPCKFTFKEGEEISFTINNEEKEEACATCMAYDLMPPSKNIAISMCSEKAR